MCVCALTLVCVCWYLRYYVFVDDRIFVHYDSDKPVFIIRECVFSVSIIAEDFPFGPWEPLFVSAKKKISGKRNRDKNGSIKNE